MKIELFLIRHGKTEAVEKHIYCGWTDLPLSEDGRREIEKYVSEGIYDRDVDIIFTSGMKRCNETMSLIFGERDYTSVSDIMEMNFGDFELHSYDELKTDPDYVRWIEDETGTVPCRGGESSGEFYDRCYRGFMSILSDLSAQKDGVKAAVVAHGGSIGGFIRKYADPSLDFYGAQPFPARGFRLTVELKEEGFKVLDYTRI